MYQAGNSSSAFLQQPVATATERETAFGNLNNELALIIERLVSIENRVNVFKDRTLGNQPPCVTDKPDCQRPTAIGHINKTAERIEIIKMTVTRIDNSVCDLDSIG